MEKETEMLEKENELLLKFLSSCSWCGGIRKITKYDMTSGKFEIKELHSKDCKIVVIWQNLYENKGTN